MNTFGTTRQEQVTSSLLHDHMKSMAAMSNAVDELIRFCLVNDGKLSKVEIDGKQLKTIAHRIWKNINQEKKAVDVFYLEFRNDFKV